ncbi:MAG: electron transfer flavoprotein subunit alpha/FixB family protein [Thermoproteota archaeon]|nr:electron transfer flavoprotein subunit alpha/FixB family protein [Thermoproteota archaeon]
MTSSTPVSYFSDKKINENLLQETPITDTEKENAIESNNYRHLYIIIEQEEGSILPVSFEMLGEGRRLIDDFNTRYKPEEKVVAIILGHNIKHLSQELIYQGADVVICADHPELCYHRNLLYTKIIRQIATDMTCAEQISSSSSTFQKPRYMFFSADDTGRHLSSTVMAELESGLASDINKLVISDLELRHEHKTKGKPIVYKKTLEMYRPDFSGFLWTTILCMDNRNPDNKKDFHPQACSIIPGVFSPIQRDSNRSGKIIDFIPQIAQEDLRVKIINRRIIKNKIDFNNKKTIVSFGKGIKESPEQNIKLIENLAKDLEAEIGISLPISKKPYPIGENLSSSYMIPDRVIGTSGRKVNPLIYFAIGISGAVQHIAGMKEAEFVISINPDTEAPIIDESDILIKGKIEDVLPLLINEVKKYKEKMKILQEIKQ